MAARKTDQVQNRRQFWSQCANHMGNVFMLLSVTAIITAYTIRKHGFVNAVWNRTVTVREDDTHNVWTFLPWFLVSPSKETSPTNFHEDHPIIYRGIQGVDYFAEKSFSTVDSTASTVYNSLRAICVRFCDIVGKVLELCAIFCYSVRPVEYLNNVIYSFGSVSRSDIAFCLTIITCVCSLVLLMKYLRLLRHEKNSHVRDSQDSSNGAVVMNVSHPQSAGNRRKRVPVKRSLFLIVGLCFLLSLPWEFIRIYQAEVAKKATVTLKGTPSECIPQAATLWQSVRAWCAWQFSWSDDPCERYHQALLVDPLWEVTPMLVLSSLLSRCILAPLQAASGTIGCSLRLLLKEIPAQWQPVVMATLVCALVVSLLVGCRYRVSVPLFLRVEPAARKTPVVIRVCGKRECLEGARHKYRDRDIQGIQLSRGDTGERTDRHDDMNLSQVSNASQISEWDF